MNKKEVAIQRKIRKSLFDKLMTVTNMIDGSLVSGNKSCGRETCKCAKGKLHRHVVISRRKDKKTNIVYVSLANENSAKVAVESYSQCKAIIQEICDINVKLFKNRLLLEAECE